MAVVDYC